MRTAQPRPHVLDELRHLGVADRGGEVERAGREDSRAGGSLVVRHLGRAARAHQVRDRREHLGARWGGGGPRVDLHSVLAEALPVGQPGARESPGRRGGVGDVSSLPGPVVARRVLHSDEPGFRATQPAPVRHPGDAVSVSPHLPEEVVRREEHQVAAEVAVALDDVVRVLRHVFRVAREDDEVVGRGQLVAGTDGRKVVVGEKVGSPSGPIQPGDEVEIPVAEPVGHAEVEEGPREADAHGRAADIPAVSPAVAVCVPEVVGLPGVRRQDDGHAGARHPPRDDERRVADPAVAGGDAKEIEPARPVPGPDEEELPRRVPVAAPVERDGLGHRRPRGLEVTLARADLARVVEDLEPKLPGVCCQPQDRLLAGRIAAVREAHFDSLDADDRDLRSTTGPVHVGAGSNPQAENVGARLCRSSGTPHDLTATRPEATRCAPNRLRRAAGVKRVRPQHVQSHDCSAVEPEADDRAVAEPVPVRAHRRHQAPIACEGPRAVGDAEPVEVSAGEQGERNGECRHLSGSRLAWERRGGPPRTARLLPERPPRRSRPRRRSRRGAGRRAPPPGSRMRRAGSGRLPSGRPTR